MKDRLASYRSRTFARGFLSTVFICCMVASYAQPANDAPCSAIALPVNASCVNTAGTVYQATTSTVADPDCGGTGVADVWYTVVVPASGRIQISVTSAGANPLTDPAVAAYTVGTCSNSSSFGPVGCNDDLSLFNTNSRLTLSCLCAGTTLYIRVWKSTGNATKRTFNICVTEPAAPPASATPCNATLVSVTAACSMTTYTLTGASSSSYPDPPCSFYFGGDMWFRFVVPSTGIAIIETQAGSLTDAAMALYSSPGGCGAFNLVECDDDDGPGSMPQLSFTGLIPGATYYLRVWGYFGATGTFGLCIHAPLSLPAGNCVYVLQLYDSNGNGWGSSSVGISINGGPYTNYTVTSAFNLALIGVNIGNVIVVQYTNSGPNQSQNSYTLSLQSGGGPVFVSGTPPVNGVVFTQTVTCTPPPSSANDCAGGSTVCGAQAFNNNSSGTGSVADLNSSNWGCLTTGERQGTWYRFAPSSAGTVGFTIAPAAAIDYDFAVWGPMATVQCPPVGAPVRCSYSSATGNTGLGNGAIDLTEGAGGDKWVALLNVLPNQIYILYVDNFTANGQSFNLTWQLGPGSSLDCTVLPIELTSFTAVPGEKGIDLHWITATEEENDRFEIERSADGERFYPIGSVPGAMNSVQEIRYLFPDENPLEGMNYYRLKQVDTDGHFEYSNVEQAVYRTTTDALLLFPNPGSDLVDVVIPRTQAGAILVVTDAMGREVRTLRVEQERMRLDASSFPIGLYAFSVRAPNGSWLAQGVWMKN